MSGAIFESGPAAARLLAAVVAAGVAIKLMDDYLDQELDALLGRRTLAAAVGPGTVAYAMAALALAMLLDGPAAGSLFLAAYAVGMAHDPAGRLPTGLAGWQEAMVAAGAGALLAGLRVMAAALASMLFIQCVDDLRDAAEDARRGHGSLAARLGRVETGLVAAAALVAGLLIHPVLVIGAALAAPLVDRGLRWAADRLPPGPGEGAGEGSP